MKVYTTKKGDSIIECYLPYKNDVRIKVIHHSNQYPHYNFEFYKNNNYKGSLDMSHVSDDMVEDILSGNIEEALSLYISNVEFHLKRLKEL